MKEFHFRRGTTTWPRGESLRHLNATPGRVRGLAAPKHNPGVLHPTVAYAHRDADSDDIQQRLRRVGPSHAPMNVDSLWKLDITADRATKTITWAAPRTDQQIVLRSAPA